MTFSSPRWGTSERRHHVDVAGSAARLTAEEMIAVARNAATSAINSLLANDNSTSAHWKNRRLCRQVGYSGAYCKTPKLRPPVSGFQGTSSGDRQSPTDPRDKPARVLPERLLHCLPRDLLVTLRNDKAIMYREHDNALVETAKHCLDHDLGLVMH
jgi:hypothetical protein